MSFILKSVLVKPVARVDGDPIMLSWLRVFFRLKTCLRPVVTGPAQVIVIARHMRVRAKFLLTSITVRRVNQPDLSQIPIEGPTKVRRFADAMPTGENRLGPL